MVVVTVNGPEGVIWKVISSNVEHRICDRDGDAHGKQESILCEIGERVIELVRCLTMR